jgi:hypothetical protein
VPLMQKKIDININLKTKMRKTETKSSNINDCCEVLLVNS